MIKQLFTIGILPILFSCSQGIKDKPKNALELSNLKGKVKSYREISYKARNINGIVQNDEKGKKNSYIVESFYAFNEQGKIIEKSNFDKEGKLVERFSYDYDTNGNIVEEKREDVNSIYKFLYSYDENNKKIGVSSYLNDSLLTSYNIKNKYRNERTIEASYVNKKGIEDLKYVWNYDKNGNVTEEIQYDYLDKFHFKNFFKYDDNNNIIEYHFETNANEKNEGYEIGVHSYVYNDKGEKVEEKYKHSYGEEVFYYLYKFDSNGDIVEENYLDSNGILSEITYTYELDEHSNWYKRTQYENGKATYIVERGIEYY